jgi:hypothetical protein
MLGIAGEQEECLLKSLLKSEEGVKNIFLSGRWVGSALRTSFVFQKKGKKVKI